MLWEDEHDEDQACFEACRTKEAECILDEYSEMTWILFLDSLDEP